MKNNQEKTMMKTLFMRLVLMGIAAAPAMSQAEGFDGSVTVGAAHVKLDEPSAKFGEYSGISDDESWLLLDLNLLYQDGLTYFGAEGKGLGLDNRRLGLKGGRYGVFGLNLRYREIPYLHSDAAKTLYEGDLDDSLVLPTTFTSDTTRNTTTVMDNLASDARTVEIATERKTSNVSFFLTPNERWRIDVGVERYDVTGHKPLGGAAFHNAAVYLPAPVDHAMEAINAALGYAADTGQWEVRYRRSTFSNDVPDFTWQNPFTQGGFTTGRTDLEPDNEQQTLTLMGALNLGPTSRLTVMTERSRLTQDDDLLPYSNNSSQTSITAALPRTSADAQIDISHVNVDLTSRPTRKLKVNTRYHYQKTDNKTDQDLFRRARTDRNEQAGLTSDRAIYNLSRDTAKQQFKIDADYVASASTSLHAAAQRDIEAMTYRAVEKTKEITLSGGFTQRFSSLAQLNVDVARAHRKAASGYDDARVFTEMHTSGYVNNPANNVSAVAGAQDTFENNPYLRQFDIADRSRRTINLGLNLYPVTDLVVGVRLRKLTDEYLGGDDLLVGLRENDNDSATLDVDYAPEQGVAVFGYVTQERGSYRLEGRQYGLNARQGSVTVADSVLGYDDPDLDWTVHNEDDILSLGVGGSYRVFNDRILLKVKYDYSKSKTDVRYDANQVYEVSSFSPVVYGKVAATNEALPTVTTEYSRLELGAEYALMKKMDLGLGVILGRFKSYDPLLHATDTAPAVEAASTGAAEVLTLIGPEEGYTSVMVYGSLTYKW